MQALNVLHLAQWRKSNHFSSVTNNWHQRAKMF